MKNIDNSLRAQKPRTASVRIALVSDVRGWAFHNRAIDIVRYLGDRYDIDVLYLQDYPSLSAMYLAIFQAGKYDLAHFFWRESIMTPEIFAPLGVASTMEHQAYLQGLESTAITTSIHDHLYLSDEEIALRAPYFHTILNGYAVISERLLEIYQNIPSYPAPVRMIEQGCDAEKFYPKNLARFTHPRGPLVVGWAGNSTWGGDEHQDAKGLHTILRPAIARLQQDGLAIIENISDRVNGALPLDEMVDYYAQLDVLVCASRHEGTPNPIIEAMACGVPIISTDVGIVREVVGEQQKEFILAERTVDACYESLCKLSQASGLRAELSRENLASIHGRTRENECLQWEQFFLDALDRKKPDVSHFAAIFFRATLASSRTIDEKNSEMATMSQVIGEQGNYIASRERIIDERVREIVALNGQLSDRDASFRKVAKYALKGALQVLKRRRGSAQRKTGSHQD